jgi:steroid delta-isomerase-like uncharacterized protein
MATDTEKKIQEEFVALNSHDVDKLLTFFTDDCVYEDVTMGLVNHGKKELKDFFNSMFVMSPDLKFELKSAFGTGDWAGIEWIMTGTYAHGTVPGMPATGKEYSIRGTSIREMRNGKVIRDSDYWNLASFLQQVGILPKNMAPNWFGRFIMRLMMKR